MSLAEQQAALMAALLGHGAAPEGFQRHRLEAARVALFNKRMRAAGQSWPAVSQVLGESFATRFMQYALETPLPQEGGPSADGRNFVQWLAKSHPLTDEAHLKALHFDALNKRKPHGWRPRRWVYAGIVWLPESRRWTIGIRIPGWIPWRTWSASWNWLPQRLDDHP